MSQWIDCSERLPEEAAWVLVCADGAKNCMGYVPGKGWSDWTNPQNPNIVISEITHWMPLPESPK